MSTLIETILKAQLEHGIKTIINSHVNDYDEDDEPTICLRIVFHYIFKMSRKTILITIDWEDLESQDEFGLGADQMVIDLIKSMHKFIIKRIKDDQPQSVSKGV